MSEKCQCGYSPTIILPGIGQSKVELFENGSKKLMAWPLDIDEKFLLKKLAFPALRMMIFRHDLGFLKALRKTVALALDPLRCNPDGTSPHDLRVVKYNQSLALCNAEEKRYIYRMIPMQNIAELTGEDHLYFFAYHSFGRPYDTAADLDKFIQKVKEETGHDKVNLISVSLGGSLTVAYLDAYGEKNDIDKIIGLVPAFHGSLFASDFMMGNLNTSDPDFIFDMLIGGDAGRTIKNFYKKMPKKIQDEFIKTAVDAAVKVFGMESASMWGVIPNEFYDELRQKHLCDGKHDELREMVDRHQKAQRNLEKLFDTQMGRGAKIYMICGYGKPMIGIIGSSQTSSDTIVHLNSASAHAHVAPLGKTLPNYYLQQNTRCIRKDHNHISPDRTVDASTCVCPETTWFFKDQVHDDLEFNDIAINLTAKIITDEVEDVFSDPGYPQFNNMRYVKRIKKDLLPAYEKADLSAFSEEDLKELNEAMAECKALLSETIGDQEKTMRVTRKLEDAERKLQIIQ